MVEPRFRTRDVMRLTGWSWADSRRLLRYMRHLTLAEQAYNLVAIRCRPDVSPRIWLGAVEVARSGESGGVVSDGEATMLVDVRPRG